MFDSRQDKKLMKSTEDNWLPWRMNELPALEPEGLPLQETQDIESEVSLTEHLTTRTSTDVHDEAREKGYQAGLRAGREEGLRQAREDGFAQGKQEGYQAGIEEARRQCQESLAPLLSLVEGVEEARKRFDGDVSAAMVELALSVGRQLARDALDARPEQVLEIVRQLMHGEAELCGRPRLWLHPRDLALVEDHLGNEIEAAGWQLQADDRMSRGGCRITCATGEIDASWEERWRAVSRQTRAKGRRTANRKSAKCPSS